MNDLYIQTIGVVCQTVGLPLSLRLAVCKGIPARSSHLSEVDILTFDFYLDLQVPLPLLLCHAFSFNPDLFSHLIKMYPFEDLAEMAIIQEDIKLLDRISNAPGLRTNHNDMMYALAIVHEKPIIWKTLIRNWQSGTLCTYIEVLCKRQLPWNKIRPYLFPYRIMDALKTATFHKRFDLLPHIWDRVESKYCCFNTVKTTLDWALENRCGDLVGAMVKDVRWLRLPTDIRDRTSLLWIKQLAQVKHQVYKSNTCVHYPKQSAWVADVLGQVLRAKDYELAAWLLKQGFRFDLQQLPQPTIEYLDFLYGKIEGHKLLALALKLDDIGLDWLVHHPLEHAPLIDVLHVLRRTKVPKTLRKVKDQSRKMDTRDKESYTTNLFLKIVKLGYVFERKEIPAAIGLWQWSQARPYFDLLMGASKGWAKGWEGVLEATIAKGHPQLCQWMLDEGCPLAKDACPGKGWFHTVYCDMQHAKRIKQ